MLPEVLKIMHASMFQSSPPDRLTYTGHLPEFRLPLKIPGLPQAHMPLSEMSSFLLLFLFLYLFHFLKVHNNFPEIHEIFFFFHAFPVPFVFLLKLIQIFMFISYTCNFIIFSDFPFLLHFLLL